MGDIRKDHDEAGRHDEGPQAVTGAGTDAAAFPVGALAGAAMGGVGGALVGNETAGARPDEVRDGADEDRDSARKRSDR